MLAAAAAAIYLGPPVREGRRPLALDLLPLSLDGWGGSDGIPESALPVDPNEIMAVRRTYRDEHRVAWISVALFTRQDDPGRRPSINLLYPEKGASRVERVSFTVSLTRPPGRAVSLPAVVIHRKDQRLIVAYWYQIGRDVYGSEYSFRLALLRSILFERRGDALLVRIAIPGEADSRPAAALDAVGRLAGPLYMALSQDAGDSPINRQARESGH